MNNFAFVFALAILTEVFVCATSTATWTYHYDAKHAIGPDNWGLVDSRCLGKAQSPIDVRDDLEVEECIGEISFNGFGEQAGASMAVENTGHYAEVFLHGDYTVTGGGLPATYRAEQFHFHWGRCDSLGSEHFMNGRAHSAEMHIVTFDTSRFGSVGEAVGAKGGLAVFGFFIDAGEKDNAAFEGLLKHFGAIKAPEEEAEIEEALNVLEMMPEDRSEYFRYDGSLTTPSCAEGVIWTLFKNPIYLSHGQLEKYRSLVDEQGSSMGNTFRPLNPLNGRTIKSNSC
ncbi:carbonic anhydrase 14-like isoform X2 [Glandiceps talaboti]